MAEEAAVQGGTPENPWFTQVPGGGATTGLSITADRGLTNQQVTGLADDMEGQNEALIAALDAIAAAITAKASA